VYSRTSIYVLLAIRTFDLRTVFVLTYYSIYVQKFDIRTLRYVLKFDIRLRYVLKFDIRTTWYVQIRYTYSNLIYVLRGTFKFDKRTQIQYTYSNSIYVLKFDIRTQIRVRISNFVVRIAKYEAPIVLHRDWGELVF
jgi:hypothetical protein